MTSLRGLQVCAYAAPPLSCPPLAAPELSSLFMSYDDGLGQGCMILPSKDFKLELSMIRFSDLDMLPSEVVCIDSHFTHPITIHPLIML